MKAVRGFQQGSSLYIQSKDPRNCIKVYRSICLLVFSFDVRYLCLESVDNFTGRRLSGGIHARSDAKAAMFSSPNFLISMRSVIPRSYDPITAQILKSNSSFQHRIIAFRHNHWPRSRKVVKRSCTIPRGGSLVSLEQISFPTLRLHWRDLRLLRELKPLCDLD